MREQTPTAMPCPPWCIYRASHDFEADTDRAPLRRRHDHPVRWLQWSHVDGSMPAASVWMSQVEHADAMAGSMSSDPPEVVVETSPENRLTGPQARQLAVALSDAAELWDAAHQWSAGDGRHAGGLGASTTTTHLPLHRREVIGSMTVQTSPVQRSGEAEDDDPSTSAVRVAARGSFTDARGEPGSFVGTFALQRFVPEFGQLAAVGILAGRLYDASGAGLGVTSRRVTVAVGAVATPFAVEVEIGPIDANLSGLITSIEPIALNIAPRSQRGNVEGILLSGISDALDRAFAGKRLVALLNALLTVLDLPGPAPAPPL